MCFFVFASVSVTQAFMLFLSLHLWFISLLYLDLYLLQDDLWIC